MAAAVAPCEQESLQGDSDESIDERDFLGLSGEDGESSDGELSECAGPRITPGRLRGQIRKLLQSTDIKVTELQRLLDVNPLSYNRFMNGKYRDPWRAMENGTYDSAARFFRKERKLGAAALGKVRKLGKAARSKDGAKRAGAAKGKQPLPDLPQEGGGITYLTPGEVRAELRAALKKFSASQADLARLADTPYQSFLKFMKEGGGFGGEGNQAYRPAADLAERIRLATGKPKSKKRKALEEEVAAGRAGFDGQPFLGVNPSNRFLCLAGERPFAARDALGRQIVHFA